MTLQTVLRISGLPDGALDAAAVFHCEHLPAVRALLEGEAAALVLVFSEASHEHTGWRRSAIQALAREAAPRRVNGIAGKEQAAIAATIAWLADAPGITGQLLPVDGTGTSISGI